MNRFRLLSLILAMHATLFLGCRTRLESVCETACDARPCPADPLAADCPAVCGSDQLRIPPACADEAESWYTCQKAARWVCTPLGAVTLECDRSLAELTDCLPGSNVVRSEERPKRE